MTRVETAPVVRETTKQVFVPGVGQHDNIGDIILRRQLLDMLRPLGRLHVYVGASPAGYDEALGLTEDDIVYRSFARWYGAGLAASIKGNTAYVFKPGEIQLTILGMKEHIGMLPLLLLLRLRGGRAIRIGVGSRNFAEIPRMLMKPSIALSDLTMWRDTGTADHMHSGGLMPDLAFGEGSSAPLLANGDTERGVLAVSMRSDRPYPSDEWIGALKQFATERELEIWTVTQVLRDNDKSVKLAQDLGGLPLEWDGTDHRAQEERLRVLYRRSRIVVSDRLHVLIGALTEGALPAGLLVGSSDKISRHFEAAGITGIAVSADGAGREDLCHHLDSVLSRSTEIFTGLDQARVELDDVQAEVERLLASPAAPAPTADVDSDLDSDLDRLEARLIALDPALGAPDPVGAVR